MEGGDEIPGVEEVRQWAAAHEQQDLLQQALLRLEQSPLDPEQRAQAAAALAEVAHALTTDFRFPTAHRVFQVARRLGPDSPAVAELADRLDLVMALERERESLPLGRILARQWVSLEGRNQLGYFGIGNREQVEIAKRQLLDGLTHRAAQEVAECLRDLTQYSPTFCALCPDILRRIGLPEAPAAEPAEWTPGAEVVTHEGLPLPAEWSYFVRPPVEIGKVLSAHSNCTPHSWRRSPPFAALVAALAALAGWAVAAWLTRVTGLSWPLPWEFVALVFVAGALPGWIAWCLASHFSYEVSYVGDRGLCTASCWRSLRKVRRQVLRFAQAGRVERIEVPAGWLFWPDERGIRQGSRPLFRIVPGADRDLEHFGRAAVAAFKHYKTRGHFSS